MKLLTLNLHCFAEETIQQNQDKIAQFIYDNDIDVVFFQEVAQKMDSPIYDGQIKTDNYGKIVMEKLDELGVNYHYHFESSNRAFNDLDEGVALLSKHRIFNKECFYVSRETSYEQWHSRKLCKGSIKIHDDVIELVSIHLGWTGLGEVFEDQVDELFKHLNLENDILLGGDFNVSEDSFEYQYLISKGLKDLYYNGEDKYFHDPTHRDYIDVKKEATRIDYILSNKMYQTVSRKLVFTEDRISDHYGVYIEIKKVEK